MTALDERLRRLKPNRRGGPSSIRQARRWLCRREGIDQARADDDATIEALLELYERRRWVDTWERQP